MNLKEELSDYIVELNDVSKLQFTVHMSDISVIKVMMVRIFINGMPLQPKLIEPDLSLLIRYLENYGFEFCCYENEENIKTGYLNNEKLREIKKFFK